MKTPRISIKIFRILGLIVLVIIAIHALLYQSLTRRDILSQIILRGEQLAYPLQQETNFSLDVGYNTKTFRGLSQICGQIKKSAPDVMAVAVVDQQRHILAHNDISRVGTQVAKVDLSKSGPLKNHFFKETPFSIDCYTPINNKHYKRPFFIMVSFSKKLLTTYTLQAFITSIVFSITAISLFLLVIYFLVNSLLGKRIAKLLEGFDALAKGNLNVRLTNILSMKNEALREKGKDELDFLMESFDEMACRLEDSDTKRRQQEKQLNFLATHDPLTGLPNRRLLEHALKKAVSRARRGVNNAFILMDLDNFKFVNDTLGHSIGDQVLVTLTDLLRKQMRVSDLLARFGGDEFALLLEGGDGIDEAEAVAKRMCQAVEEYRFTIKDHSFHLGLSMGIVPIDGKYDPEVILSQADTAMYSAKKYGRNRVVLFRDDDDAMIRLSEANEWATRIKDALLEDRFVLFYQPIVRLSNNQVEHYEALIRLKTEKGELIAPDVFIPAAEQFGLMPQLDRWVVKHAINTLLDYPDIRLFINLSCYSLLDIPFLEFIEESLLQYGIDPKRLGFEITETAIIQDFVLAEHWIRRLKSLGCFFALDDFGSGFNSFLYLRRLPVDQLKLDGVFIRNLGVEPSQLPLVQAMHQLAKSLGIETVAEFVENEEVVQILKKLGVTYGQGYHLGKPNSSLESDSITI